MTLVIGHRGAPRVAPENSLASFRAAARLGADGVELDVRRTADARLAVHHDVCLAGGRAVVETRGADLPPGVAELAAALDACRGFRLVDVEIKNRPGDPDFDPTLGIAAAAVEVLLARPADEQARLLVSCFHLPTLDRVRALAPALATGWLVGGPAVGGGSPPGPGAMDATVAVTARHGHAALHPHHAFASPELVATAHAAGVAVNVWTCDDPERIGWLAGIGVDGVVTNVPEAARRALGR